MTKRSTLKDIAKSLNVSTTTVSRAINNKEDISVHMRKKVLETAKLLNYKPNTVAVSLRKKSSGGLIGVIIPSVDHYFFSTILKGIITSKDASNNLIIIGESSQNPSKERQIINRFESHYISGLIFVPSRHPDSIKNVETLTKDGVPFVLIDRKFANYNNSYVQHDDFNGAYQAVEHLILRGRTNIALLKGDDECSISNERFRGYKSALEAHQFALNPEYVISCPYTNKQEGFEATSQLFQSGRNRPDAIFCITDNLASGVYEYAYSMAIRIPEELSVIGFSNSEISVNLIPKLTTVEQNGLAMGQEALKFLLAKIKNESRIDQKTFQSNLIVRGSSS